MSTRIWRVFNSDLGDHACRTFPSLEEAERFAANCEIGPGETLRVESPSGFVVSRWFPRTERNERSDG